MSTEAELEMLLRRVDRAVENCMEREAGESESGLGHSRALVEIVSALNQAGLTDGQIRVGRQQVNPLGGHFANRPDIAYQAPDGTWVNVEIDTGTRSRDRHMRQVTDRGGQSQHNVFLLVDRTTGRVVQRNQTGRALPAGTPVLPVAQLPQPRRAPPPAARPAPRRSTRSRESEAEAEAEAPAAP